MRINLKFFIVIFCGIYVCQAMEEKSFSKRIAHSPVMLDSSHFVQQIDEILKEVIKNNRAIITSERLLELEKNSVKQGTKYFKIAIKLSQGKEYKFAENIIPDTNGRVGFYPLENLMKSLYELGMVLEQFSLQEKIDKECYNKHLTCLGTLEMLRYKIKIIEELQNASEEKPRGFSKKSSDEKCLIH